MTSETQLIDCPMSFQHIATTKLFLQTIVWLLRGNDCWREGYFVKWPHSPWRKEINHHLLNTCLLPAHGTILIGLALCFLALGL